MNGFKRAAVFAAGFAAVSAVAMPMLARAADLSPSLQSFGQAKALSAYALSAPGMTDGGLENSFANSQTGSGLALSNGYPTFAASTLLSPNLALDSGSGLDAATRFLAYDGALQPFLAPVSAPYLSLANGGHYGGFTYVPAANLRLRVGAAINSERLDHFSFDPAQPTGPLALTYDASQSKSLLGGLSWDVSSALGLDVTAISSERSGVPVGFNNASAIAPKASTQALGFSAHLDMGQGWVTTASFSDSLTQLDQRDTAAAPTSLHEQSYSFAIAKHGLFGDDALGLSFSRPAPSLANSFAAGLTASGDLPPVMVTQGLPGRAPESDFQLGYVTNFLDGAVALQTNAGYQTNFQGQSGATSGYVLSRAKIKF